MEELFDKGWHAITVKSKLTGELIQIKNTRFQEELHEKVEGSKPIEKIVEKKAEPVEVAVTSANNRFLELKAKGFKNLLGDERKEYKALKKNLNL